MKKLRIIPRLDIKGSNLVKGINLEGLRIIGDPAEYAKKYYNNGADEIYYWDTVASLYGRNNLKDIVTKTAKNISIPLLVGGGLRSIEDIKTILNAGADKVAINTAAVSNPNFIKKAVNYFGSSTILLSIDYKIWPNDSFKKNKNKTVSHSELKDISKWKNHYQVYTENGRQQTGLDAYEWSIEAEKLGIGEIILTSIDKEGIQKGFELELSKKISKKINIPIIISGGCGKVEDVYELGENTNCEAVSIASSLHYNKFYINDLKKFLSKKNFEVIFHD